MKALLATILLIASITLAPTRLQADEAHYDNLIRELESVRALAQRYRKTDQTHPIVFRYDAFDRRVAGLIADIKYHMQQRLNGAKIERFTLEIDKE